MTTSTESIHDTTVIMTEDLLTQFSTELCPQKHTLQSRDLSIENATSFIIIISIGFVAFTLLCAATSIYYRRRMMLAYQGDIQAEWTTVLDVEDQGKPQIWDVPIRGSKTFATRVNGYGRFASLYPLSARKTSPLAEHAPATTEAPAGGLAARMRRWGHRFGNSPSRDIEAVTEDSSEEEDVEVAMLISMPSPSNPTCTALSTPVPPAFEGQDGTRAHASEESGGGIRSDYVIGVLHTPYPREAQKSDST